jgi:hypothetical protein
LAASVADETAPPIAKPVVVGAPDSAPLFDAPEPQPATATKRKAGRPRKAAADSKPPSGATATPRRDAAPKAPGRPSKDAQMTEKLADIYGLGGLILAYFWPEDGRSVIEHSEKCAQSLVVWSHESPGVARFLDRLVTTSAIGVVITAHVGLGLAIAKNHGALPSLAAGDGEGIDGQQPPPAAFPPGFDFEAMAKDPRKIAALGELFDMDLSGAGANGSE